jgi:hypothetical protein
MGGLEEQEGIHELVCFLDLFSFSSVFSGSAEKAIGMCFLQQSFRALHACFPLPGVTLRQRLFSALAARA